MGGNGGKLGEMGGIGGNGGNWGKMGGCKGELGGIGGNKGEKWCKWPPASGHGVGRGPGSLLSSPTRDSLSPALPEVLDAHSIARFHQSL